MSTSTDELYGMITRDLSLTLQMLDKWDEDYHLYDLPKKINLGMLANKVVNFICGPLPRECDKNIENFKRTLCVEPYSDDTKESNG